MRRTNWIGKKMVCPPEACSLFGLPAGAVVTITADLGRESYKRGTVLVKHGEKEFAVFESRLRTPKGIAQTRPLP